MYNYLVSHIVYVLLQQHHFASHIVVKRKFCLKCTTAETKLYLLFFYYGITMLFFISALVLVLRNINSLNKHIDNFITCSAGGFKEECEIHRENAERSSAVSNIVVIFATFLVSLLNLSHLMYIVNIHKVVKTAQKCIATFCG